MRIFLHGNSRYCQEERDLCNLHRVSESDVKIDAELKQIHSAFAADYPQLKIDTDFEFPDWHHNLRLFWAYLHHDDFFTPNFIPRVQKILQAAPRSWFAQFKCYSPSTKSEESNPNGFVGTFLIYKDSVIFSETEYWPAAMPRLGINVCSRNFLAGE
jgi:hypothetical protein